jgi:hypothetical protein
VAKLILCPDAKLQEQDKIIADLREQNVKINAELYKAYKEYEVSGQPRNFLLILL